MDNNTKFHKSLIEKVNKELIQIYKYKNIHQLPKLKKIVVNSGINSKDGKEIIKEISKQITYITCQQGVFTLATKSISNFSLRKGMVNGFKVTLRKYNMWNFFYKLINISLANVRDFRGLSSKMDGNGNYTIGIKDNSVFHEYVSFSESLIKKNIGMNITIVTSTNKDNEAFKLLELLGMPFKNIINKKN